MASPVPAFLPTRPLVVVALEAENVQRLKVVRIVPSGDGLVLIKGENAQGKSSVLDAMAYALGGVALCPAEVIRRGEEEAEVKVDLGELIVTRRWTASGSRLEVTHRDGVALSSPQAVLNKLAAGGLLFDPVAFAREKPRDQLETLRKLVGLDFSAHDKRRLEIYDQRTAVNRDVVTAQAIAESLPKFTDADGPAREIDLSVLLAEKDALDRKRQEQAGLVAAVAAAEQRVGARQREAAAADQHVERLRAELAAAENAARATRIAAQREHEALVEARLSVDTYGPAPSTDDVRARITGAQAANKIARQREERDAAEEKWEATRRESDRLTREIEALDKAKAAKIAATKFPIDGLSLGADGVTFQGLPFEQASSAEKIRVSVAMGIALNPLLRIVLVRDGSFLDENSLHLVGKMAHAAGAQVWVERVGKDGLGGIIIEDGEVLP